MNPGGGYSNRIQQLGTFAASMATTQQGMLCEDINDPLYGNSGGAQERSALLAAVHELRVACRGLLQKLMHLQSRCTWLASRLEMTACCVKTLPCLLCLSQAGPAYPSAAQHSTAF